MKKILMEKLDGAQLTRDGRAVGTMWLDFQNGNGEPNSRREYPWKIGGKTYYPDLVGTIELNGEKRRLFIEVFHAVDNKSFMRSVRQAMAYKGKNIEDILSRRPPNTVVLAPYPMTKGAYRFCWTRTAWHMGLGFLDFDIDKDYFILSFSEQEKYKLEVRK